MKTLKAITIEGETYELNAGFLSQVLETAVEGACSYWADVLPADADDDEGNGGDRELDMSDYVEEDDDEDDEDTPRYTAASFLVSKDPTQGGTLDLEGIADAIERVVSGEVDISPAIREIITAAVRDDDAAEIDAEAADCIVQVGLFDEVVYG